MPRQETTLGCLGALIVAAVLGGFAWRMLRSSADEGDASRMRRVYVALSMYEQASGGPAPDLLAARYFGADDADFRSERDPFAKAAGAAFPIDSGMPDRSRRSPIRISFSYLWAFRTAGRVTTKPWLAVRGDPHIGLLASEWGGSVQPGSDFWANVSGPVLRINTDGSLFKTGDRGGPKPVGNAEDLFFRR